MTEATVVELGEGRLLLDLHFRDHEGLIASYLLPQEEGWTLVETGPTTCRAPLLAALSEAGVQPTDVRRVIVSHIHLDHAGGVGALAEELPRAIFYAHERGVQHLVDPTRLIASARRAWGAAADPLWGSIVAIPASRIAPLSGGEKFPVRGGDLEVIATPGHASHHLSFFDSGTGSLLSGDSAGVRVAGLWRPRPAVPPPELDVTALITSLEAMASRNPTRILYTHFGPASDVRGALDSYRQTVLEWKEVALNAARLSPTVESVARALEEYESSAARTHGAPAPSEDRGTLVSGFELAAQGFLRYFETRGLLTG